MTFKNIKQLITEIGKQPMQEQELLKQGLKDLRDFKSEEQLISESMAGKPLQGLLQKSQKGQTL